uniref:Methionyl-tRNA formyltransferase n=1 Tax=Candidatus Kentrum sp. MB TaxID=2138164 RepID=A0A450Y2Q1_9GAMM|nr:MAG: methionyl-tRNA formyltransferase [Candidatus Kentron sp. MB]VFK77380.1 MAG: methionyl-tRNA formyltransferase [Candidatus Kentron sp. MB]
MRITFAGTPDFAAIILKALLQAAHQPKNTGTDWSVSLVYTQPDRPVGRGRKLALGPVKRLAMQHGLPIQQPESCRDPVAWRALLDAKPDVLVVAAYGIILPREVLEIPRYGCINVHASLLPRWRGAAPIQRAILAGDTETGVSIMHMEEGLDTGPVLRMARCPIRPEDTSDTLHDRLAALGAQTLIHALDDIATGRANPIPQDHARATYAKRITKTEGELDWYRTAIELERQVRAFAPWPVSYTTFDGQPLRVWESRVVMPDAQKAAPGTVTACSATGIDIATREGELRLLTVQRPGAKPISVADFMHGYRKK